jgi:replicative DNA helicase
LFTSGNAKAWPGSLIWPVGRASAETRNPWATSGNRRGVKLGPAGISDPLHALRQSAEPVFIVEGIFDAMSLTEQGHLAVALNGTGQCAMLVSGLKALRERQTLPKVVVALDNDQPGQQAQTELLTALEAAGIINSSHSWNQFKDANEMHVASLGRKATA